MVYLHKVFVWTQNIYSIAFRLKLAPFTNRILLEIWIGPCGIVKFYCFAWFWLCLYFDEVLLASELFDWTSSMDEMYTVILSAKKILIQNVIFMIRAAYHCMANTNIVWCSHWLHLTSPSISHTWCFITRVSNVFRLKDAWTQQRLKADGTFP